VLIVNLCHFLSIISQAVAASCNTGLLSAESFSSNSDNEVRDTEAIPGNRFRLLPSIVLNIADLEVIADLICSTQLSGLCQLPYSNKLLVSNPFSFSLRTVPTWRSDEHSYPYNFSEVVRICAEALLLGRQETYLSAKGNITLQLDSRILDTSEGERSW
jgi:hypothetical protein